LIEFLKKHKTLRIIFIVIAAGAAVILIYGVFIEPRMLIKRRFSVDLQNGSYAELSENETCDSKLKIITIADLHIGYGTPMSYVRKLVAEINAESPDLILFTGDFKTRSAYLDRRVFEATEAMSGLTATYGKFAVHGNHDTFAAFTEIMEKSGFTILTNDSVTITINGETVFIGGVNSRSLSPNPEKMMKGYTDKGTGETPDIAIILAHEPDLAKEFDDRADNALILSGHIHGGQINIPFLTKWFVTSGGKGNLMTDGFYESDGNTVFVSTGIGMSAFPMRFRVPPQFEVIYIV
jgi:predicted MPP superfamily phosphohydrolase